ncbi:MAG: FxsA family protein, partial [Psychrobacter sp.]|nr:FxsA family protein [Psychrobacter sp.]
AMAAAGILLLIPGVLSDFLALLVVLPPVQKKLKNVANNYVMNNQQKMMEMMAKQMGGQMGGGQNPFGGAGGMGGQNPFGGAGGMGGQNPFGQQQNPFGDSFKQHTTVDGTAKDVPKDVKKITKSANDE